MSATSGTTTPQPAGGRAYRAVERRVDRWVHATGIAAGLTGAPALAVVALERCGALHRISIGLYLAGLLAMLGFSAAYHLTHEPVRREILRRFDHAAIFLLIAGTYTPFAAAHLHDTRAILLTALVWAIAILGIAVKLVAAHRFERLSIVAYLLLGWVEFLGLEPELGALDPTTMRLIAAGGLLYTGGVAIHLWRRLPFHIALWHALVLAAAACHYAAVLQGVVLGDCAS
jgi:hemolysin III